MVRQVPNNPTFRLVRNIYITILVLNAIAVLGYLVGAVIYGVLLTGIGVNTNLRLSSEEDLIKNFFLKVVITLLSILFVFGLVKQICSWVAVIHYNIFCIMMVMITDILSLVVNFGFFFTGFIPWILIAVAGCVGYILDISLLSYMYIQIRQYDMS